MRAKTAVAITLAGLLIAPALAQLAQPDPSASPGEESDIPPPTEVIQVPSPPPAPDPVTELPQPTPSPEASAPAPEEEDNNEVQGGQDEVEGREEDNSA